jgi:hypothetical protein
VRRLLGALAGALATSACISDVPIPPCVREHSCGEGGEGGEADTNATSGSSAHAGNSRGGEDSTMAGAAMAMGGEVAGGSGSTVGMGGESGESGGSGDGGAPPNTCEQCVVLPLDLPAPCSGGPYSARLKVEGGVAPYSWRLTPQVEGWSINLDPQDPTQALVTSEAASSGDTALTLELTDSAGKHKTQSYTVRAREACWFAYTAVGSKGPQLRLLDPLVDPPAPAPLDNNTGVYDFQFSPDGTYLAYRFGADAAHPQGQHLALVELATLEEQVLSFGEDFVTSFAWSPDSSVLAASFNVGGTTHLGALRMPAPGSDDSPASLTPTLAYVDSDFSWIGNHFIAYHAEKQVDESHPGQFTSNPDKYHTAFVAELGDAGFAAQVIISGTTGPDVVLRPTDEGFFLITNNLFTKFTQVVGGVSDLSAWHFGISLVAPSGKYSALIDGDKSLQILLANGGIQKPPVATAKPGETCPMPLGWAKGAERIACVADVANEGGATTHGEVRFFDLHEGGSTLAMTTLAGFCEEDVTALPAASCGQRLRGYAYGTAQANGRARGFSPSGRWFAFARAEQNDTYLYWADLNADRRTLKGSRFYLDGGDPTRLVFSPDERFVLFQQGAKLNVQELVSGEFHTLNTQQTLGQDCSEDFAMAPNAYCGDTERAARLRWSPDSTLVAYRASGALTVANIAQFPQDHSFPLAAPECGEACAGQFEFQPSTTK